MSNEAFLFIIDTDDRINNLTHRAITVYDNLNDAADALEETLTELSKVYPRNEIVIVNSLARDYIARFRVMTSRFFGRHEGHVPADRVGFLMQHFPNWSKQVILRIEAGELAFALPEPPGPPDEPDDCDPDDCDCDLDDDCDCDLDDDCDCDLDDDDDDDDDYPEEYLITIETNGGIPDIDPLFVEYGEEFSDSFLPVITKDGYVFIGWFLDADFFEPASFPIRVEEDIVLYAKWEEE